VELIKTLSDAGLLHEALYLGGFLIAILIIRGFSIKWGDKMVSLGKHKDDKIIDD
jgi:hypothetical protein